MQKLNKLLKKNKSEIIFLVLFSALVLSLNYLSICSSYLKHSSFDLQTLLTWDYSAAKGLIPYRDLYYPYGLLFYYKTVNPFFAVLYLLTPVLSLLTAYFVIRNL